MLSGEFKATSRRNHDGNAFWWRTASPSGSATTDAPLIRAAQAAAAACAAGRSRSRDATHSVLRSPDVSSSTVIGSGGAVTAAAAGRLPGGGAEAPLAERIRSTEARRLARSEDTPPLCVARRVWASARVSGASVMSTRGLPGACADTNMHTGAGKRSDTNTRYSVWAPVDLTQGNRLIRIDRRAHYLMQTIISWGGFSAGRLLHSHPG